MNEAKLNDGLLGGRYRLKERIGQGAMGVVHLAEDLDLGRDVALKLLHERSLTSSKAIARFDREADALAKISHDSIVTIFDRGISPSGAPFFVMEFIEGASLSDVLTSAQLEGRHDNPKWLQESLGIDVVNETSFLRLVMRWSAELANALSVAHATGIFHRDVKPSNIIIRQNGTPVLLDFGIAASLADESLTQAESTLGTPAYMPPETLGHQESKNLPAHDVYSLTATLYHLLTLRPPFEGTPQEILAGLVTREPVPAAKLRLGLPRDAQAILDCGMARQPQKRYESIEAFERDVRSFLAFEPIKARPISRAARFFRSVRRSRVAAAVALAAVLLGLVTVVQSVRDSRAVQAREAFHHHYPHVPANLGIVGLVHRVIEDPDLAEGVMERLDQLVAAGHQPVTSHALRGAHRLDTGDAQGCIEDMGAVADALGTPYGRALGERYAAISADIRHATEVDLEDLPAPTSALDHYMAGFHCMRQLRYGEAGAWLDHPGLKSVRHAQELLLLSGVLGFERLKQRGEMDELYRVAQLLTEEVSVLEGYFGYRSAMTAHLLGIANAYQERRGQAIVYCEQGIALAPASHVILQNAAYCAQFIGRYDEGRAYLDAGLRIRPGYVAFLGIKSQMEVRDGNLDAARAAYDAMEFSPTELTTNQRAFALAKLELGVAEHLLLTDPEGARKAANAVIAALQEVPADHRLRVSLQGYAEAILEGDEDAMPARVLRELAKQPLSIDLIKRLMACWPSAFGGPNAAEFQTWMGAIESQVTRTERITTTGMIPTPRSAR